MNNVKTYTLENVTIYTVDNKITMAKSNITGKFISHVVAQAHLSDYLSKQSLSYMLLNTLLVFTLIEFMSNAFKRKENSFVTYKKRYRLVLIDYVILILGSIDFIAYMQWIN